MKLIRLELQDFKQFREPLAIDGLQSGINLFVGPNESGKTTLIDAIRAAFFERHKSNSVTHLQPWDDSGAAPEVTLAFVWQDERWRLQKRFLKKARSDLHIGQRQFNGDEADDKLSELLGYRLASRGSSKPEYHGIPGLLWAEQGGAQNINAPANSASDYLQQALGNTLGEVASSSGDELIRRVEAERSELLTKTGRPTGAYRDTSEQSTEHEQELAKLEQKIAEYCDQVDRLGKLRQQQQDIDSAEPWQAQREQATQAQAKLDNVQALRDAQRQAETQQDNCRQQQKLYRQQLQGFEQEEQQVAQRQKAKEAAQQKLDDLKAGQPILEQRLKAANEAYDKAKQTLQAVGEQDYRQTRQAEHDQLAKQLQRQDTTLADARALQAQIGEQRRQLQMLVVDPALLKKLQDVEAALRDNRACQQAVATRLSWDLQPGQAITLAGESVRGKNEALLLKDTRIDILNVGTLNLQPGGSDVAELRREHDSLQGERGNLLQKLGADSLPQAEQRAEQYRALKAEADNRQTRLDTLAPDGVDMLDTEVNLARQKQQQLTEELARLPSPQPDLPDLSAAKTAERTAHETLRAVEGEQNTLRNKLAVAESEQATATEELNNATRVLEAPDRQQRQQDANKQLTDLKAEEQLLQEQLEQLQRQIESANPELLQQDVERHTRSAAAMESEAQNRSIEINKLEAALEARGADGLEEKAAELRRETANLQRRSDELAARAAALDLLLQLLRDQRQVVTRKLQEPLQKHLNHYLKLLFPGASLNVDENLVPQSLSRQNGSAQEQGELTDFSLGSREQMGLISRLAYADLLKEAGRPTLLILDDALVHSDPERLQQMKRILFDAARRHQILLFSCHPDNWRDLGVAPNDMQTLKATAL